MKDIISKVSMQQLESYVIAIEGLRHGWENYDELDHRAELIEDAFRSFALSIENQPVPFHGRSYRNITGTLHGTSREKDPILLGAHYDAAPGSPGADDNASGVAVLLETARILSGLTLETSVQFTAFTLEEPQPQTVRFLIGSDLFAREAKRAKRRYRTILVLESVGYTDDADGSQIVPFLLGKRVPGRGNFLGVISNQQSKGVMESFCAVSQAILPDLCVVPYKVPLSGRFFPETRFSDHASFWSCGYPAVMLTDTAMFRNPHYHTAHDTHETLDFSFMQRVTQAVIASILSFSGR